MGVGFSKNRNILATALIEQAFCGLIWRRVHRHCAVVGQDHMWISIEAMVHSDHESRFALELPDELLEIAADLQPCPDTSLWLAYAPKSKT